jgi:GWxTD domain-containing protein
MLIFMIGLLAAPLAEAQLSVEYAEWEKGPEGFLLTKKEKKEWSKIKTDEAAEHFIELFWARRNPELTSAYNPFKAEFEAKVRFADETFGDKNHLGSLTDRGRVLILMGRPENRQVRGPAQTVPAIGSTQGGTDAVEGGTEVWLYIPEDLPEGFKVKGSQIFFMFYEEKLGSNVFSIDRSNRESFKGMNALTLAPEAYVLHPNLKEVPKPISIADARSAQPAHLGWLDGEEAPFNDAVRVISEAGVSDGINEPLWVHIELPADAPQLDLLAGRVSTADGEVLSNFEIDAAPLAGQYGSAYHLSFPLEPGSYKVDIVGAAGGEPQVTESIDVELSAVPEEGTWMSPLWIGIGAQPQPESKLGAPFTFGGWHLVPVTGPDYVKADEIAYFGFVVRPALTEVGAVDLKARIRVKRDGKTLGQALIMPLDASQIMGDLYMYGNSIGLSKIPEAGSYEFEFRIMEEISETAVERTVPIDITESISDRISEEGSALENPAGNAVEK